MPVEAIGAALLSAVIHAAWNAALKAGRDRLADSALVAAGWLALGVALALWKGAPDNAAAWTWLLISAAVHSLYWLGLTKGYDAGDLSHVYTLSRGLAPAAAAALAFAIAGELPSPAALAGVALVCAGVLAVGASPNAPMKATAWALFTAAMIGGYSLFDALGARATGDAATFLAWNMITAAIPILAFTIWRRGPRALAEAVRRDWRRGLAAGFVSGAGYGVVLYAQMLAPVAQVTALRETSVVFAALIAFAFLRERLSARRWGGVAIVAAGAALIAFN